MSGDINFNGITARFYDIDPRNINFYSYSINHTWVTLDISTDPSTNYLEQILQQTLESQITRNSNRVLNIDHYTCNNSPEQICSICQDSYEENNTVSKLNCNHIFHYDCIQEWGKHKAECPECRNPIPYSE